MAEAVFFLHGKFGHGFSQLWQEKNRIITKPARAAFFGDDLAFTDAFENLESGSLLEPSGASRLIP